MEPGQKARLAKLLGFCRWVFQYGFIPLILYLGFQQGSEQGMPPLTWHSLFIS